MMGELKMKFVLAVLCSCLLVLPALADDPIGVQGGTHIYQRSEASNDSAQITIGSTVNESDTGAPYEEADPTSGNKITPGTTKADPTTASITYTGGGENMEALVGSVGESEVVGQKGQLAVAWSVGSTAASTNANGTAQAKVNDNIGLWKLWAKERMTANADGKSYADITFSTWDLGLDGVQVFECRMDATYGSDNYLTCQYKDSTGKWKITGVVDGTAITPYETTGFALNKSYVFKHAMLDKQVQDITIWISHVEHDNYVSGINEVNCLFGVELHADVQNELWDP